MIKEKKEIMEDELERLFCLFLNESSGHDKDIEYCLLQSSVEPIIRFKFGSWLNSKLGDRITLNLMEANRLDLVIGIDKKVYFIEFGHLLNILKHSADLNYSKVNSDRLKLNEKAKKLISKIEFLEKDFFSNKEIIFVVCSLFSDIKVRYNDDFFETTIDTSRLFSGTLFKYGKLFLTNGFKEYFENYLTYLNVSYDKTEEKYLTGYKEYSVLPGKISLHYRLEFFRYLS